MKKIIYLFQLVTMLSFPLCKVFASESFYSEIKDLGVCKDKGGADPKEGGGICGGR